MLDDRLLHGELLHFLDTKQCDPMILSLVEEIERVPFEELCEDMHKIIAI